ncbi:diguanylate cyclase [Tumebacillus sp. DT12]|uniref:Diguanylate cyclase n=1 Tax=Tumebacillus lacus TaxID=2995335 RepID=A0ABT3WZF1_9BACL|nr:diguanylate cyclase [Tumebacillus lacus]MCX7568897.1 diguanylate cyclase [Tumebacillus lacus]
MDLISHSSHFGDLMHGVKNETEERVLVLRLPTPLVSFLRFEQIRLRAHLFQDPALPMLRLLDVYSQGEAAFLVYQPVDGARPLLDYLADKSLPETLHVLISLCNAVAALHEKTMWHGGIVPEYVWVLPDGEIRLLTMVTDSPLALFNACGNGEPMQVFAPETLTMSPLDARTDIFNLGVLFYWLLTRRYPFSDEDGALHPPSRINEHIPPQLDRLVLTMINQKPSKRIQWIGQIVDELSRMIGEHNVTAPGQERCVIGAQHLFSAEFTGRHQEAKQLSEFYDGMIAGKRQAMLVSGKHGVGRKRLIYELSGRYMDRVSSISCNAKEMSFAAVEDLAIKMFMLCSAVPTLNRLGEMYVRRLAPVLPRVAYEYREMLAADKTTQTEMYESDSMLFEFFCEVIETYGEPMVFEIYDVHLLDSDSMKFFKKLIAHEAIAFGLIGVTEEPEGPFTDLFSDHLHLDPLPLPQMRECVLSRFGDADFLSDEFIEWLNHHARGSLEQVFQLIEYLADTKQIYLQRYHWRMVPGSVEELDIPQSMESLILFRLDRLNPLAKEVCQAMSLFKGAFVHEAIAKAVGLDSVQEALEVMHFLEEQGLVLQTSNLYRFPSNNVKLHIYNAIEPDTRRGLHRKLAQCLVEVGSAEYLEIAHHFEKGEVWEQAILLNIVGGRRCFRRQMLAEAEAHIRKAIELYGHLEDRVCPNSLFTFQARLLRLLGFLEESARVYSELYERTKQLTVLISLSMIYCNVGRFHLIKPYLDYIEQRLRSSEPLKPKQRLNLMVIKGSYNIEVDGNYGFIQEMEEYQSTHGTQLRAEMKPRDYVSWLYNLQVLLTYVPGVPWEQRSRYLHEAASLAEHHNFRNFLVGIYNSMAIGFQETDPLRAKDYYMQSAQLAFELGDKSKEAIAYINLVDIYRLLGDMYHSQRYIELARETGTSVFKESDTYLMQNEIEHYLFIEDYKKAEQVIDALVRKTKWTGQQKMREFSFLNRFRSFVEQGRERCCDRMWPVVEQICKNRKFEIEHQYLRAQYFMMKHRYAEVVEELVELIDQTDVPTEVRIRRNMLLVEAYLQTGRWQDGLEIALSVQKLIHNTGYVGYLARAHFYLGRLYQLTHQFVLANLNYKRALMGFRKLNQQNRLIEIDRLMRQTNQEMVKSADRIIEKMQTEVREDNPRGALAIADGGVRLKEWALTIARERQEMIDTLTDNEILLDAIRRVSSSIMVKTVCENLAAVAFENLLFDHLHLYVKLGGDRVEMLQLNEQLQAISHSSSEVDALIAEVIELERPVEREGRGAYLYGLPVFAHDQQVIAVMVLEKLTLQTPFTVRDRRFITSFAQLVSSNVENAIMYEVMITDNLTGLYQRNYFMKRLGEEFNKVKRYGVDLSFLMIDLDDFSKVNNVYGHNEGDRVLRMVAKTLVKSVRNVDVVGRFGGEEMIVILPNTDGPSAKIVAERILQALRGIQIEGDRYRVTGSIGVASCDMDQPEDALDLIEKADQAETYAKRTGKNRIVCHWEMEQEAVEREHQLACKKHENV